MCAAEGEELAKINTKLLIKIVQYVVLTVLVLLVVICAAVFIQTKVNPDKIPSIFGYKPFVVLSGSMETEIFKGDLAVTREVDAESLQKNDIVAFRDAENHVVTHRVVDIIDVNGEKKLVTKGDNNNSNDSDTVRMKDVEGKYLFKLSGFGNLVMMMQEPLTLVVVLVIILVVGGIWMMLGNNKLSKEEREELEKLRKERSKSIEKNNK
ncbi:MAG: signal peptidase I [Candidatus Saccharimonadaceae bacterium]|nr:signal peptidase I [Candidatus Saccharimonadaceae bacterium]